MLFPARPPLLSNDYKPQLALALTGVVIVSAIIILRSMGRVWWCSLGDFSPITLDAWGPHNSQHFADPYVFSHLLHGVILFFVFNFAVLRRKPLWGLFFTTLLEVAWEIFENTPFTINHYRAATAAVGYTGDSVINSFGDILACVGGWFLARKVGIWWSIAVFFVAEIGCLIWIKDNLTLNVIMILHPIKAIKTWQSGM